MKRILIIGNPGSGKSILAAQMGQILDLPVIHLDKYFWNPCWVITKREIWREKVKEFVSGQEWIIDGNYQSSNDLRFPNADTLIYLDFSTPASLRRIFKRIIQSYNTVRPDMADGCPERLDFEFFKWAWDFRKSVRPKIISDVNKYFKGKSLVILKSPKQVRKFIDEIKSSRKKF